MQLSPRQLSFCLNNIQLFFLKLCFSYCSLAKKICYVKICEKNAAFSYQRFLFFTIFNFVESAVRGIVIFFRNNRNRNGFLYILKIFQQIKATFVYNCLKKQVNVSIFLRQQTSLMTFLFFSQMFISFLRFHSHFFVIKKN